MFVINGMPLCNAMVHPTGAHATLKRGFLQACVQLRCRRNIIRKTWFQQVLYMCVLAIETRTLSGRTLRVDSEMATLHASDFSYSEQYTHSSNNTKLHCYSRHVATTVFTFMDNIARLGWKVCLCKQFRVYVYIYSAYAIRSGYAYYFINFNICLYCNCATTIQSMYRGDTNMYDVHSVSD